MVINWFDVSCKRFILKILIFIIQIIHYRYFMNLCLKWCFSKIFHLYFLVFFFMLWVIFFGYVFIFDNWNFVNLTLLWRIFRNIQLVFLNVKVLFEIINFWTIFIDYLYLMNLTRFHSFYLDIFNQILLLVRFFNWNFNVILNQFFVLLIIWTFFNLQTCNFRCFRIFRRFVNI